MDPDLLCLLDRRLALSQLFAGNIFTLEDVGYRSKPNPDLFLHAAEALGSDPGRCLVIEDAPHGIEAARRAGMSCIGIASTYPPGRLNRADAVVKHFSDIDLRSLPDVDRI